jgi:L-2-amino-thiazoline-4-carboxylic acid hydrolase
VRPVRRILAKGTRRVQNHLQPASKWALRRALLGRVRCRHEPQKGRFSAADLNRIHEQAWRNFDMLFGDVPEGATVGTRMNLMLACLSLSAFRALMALGVERDYAIELFADVAWRVYEKWGQLPRFISRFLTRDPVKRMRWCVNMFLRFPFNPPGYAFERLPSDDGISLDMLRCPVAEYLCANGAADLCVGSWCNLDYGLAEMWGGRLERSGTLAAGDDRCGFRFKSALGGKRLPEPPMRRLAKLAIRGEGQSKCGAR